MTHSCVPQTCASSSLPPDKLANRSEVWRAVVVKCCLPFSLKFSGILGIFEILKLVLISLNCNELAEPTHTTCAWQHRTGCSVALI